MNTRIGVLGALAVLQLLLIGVVYVVGATETDVDTFIEFAPQEVSALAVSDQAQDIGLARDASGSWRVGELPADQNKVQDVLEKLAGQDAPWPVATSAASAARFEVASDNFQRKLVLTHAGRTATVYLGTAPGFQRVHARLDGSDDIYSIALSNYEVPATVDGWLDKEIFAAEATPRAVHVNTASAQHLLRETEDGWQFNDAPANPDEAVTYVNRFKNLRVLGVYSGAEAEPQGEIRLEFEDGEAAYTIAKSTDDYVIQRVGESGAYRLATYVAEQLLMQDVDFTLSVPAVEPSDS